MAEDHWITLKCLDGRVISLGGVEKTDTIAQIRESLIKQEGKSMKAARFVLQGKCLDDADCLIEMILGMQTPGMKGWKPHDVAVHLVSQFTLTHQSDQIIKENVDEFLAQP